MKKGQVGNQDATRWDAILFLVAGGFLLVNVVCLWARIFSDFQLSILWAALPGITGFAASVAGLFKLYPRISSATPWLARFGAGFALAAGSALCVAAVWILVVSIFWGGISDPPPGGILALIGIFIVSMVIAFVCNALAFLVGGSSRKLGYLLLVPVTSWSGMLVVGVTKGVEAGVSLDIYTNGFIAAAFLFIGFILQKDKVDDMQVKSLEGQDAPGHSELQQKAGV